MNLSMLVLKDSLTQWAPVLSGKNVSSKNYLGVQNLPSDNRFLPQHYVLGIAKNINEHPFLENRCIISIGKPDKQVLKNNKCLYLKNTVSLEEVFYEIQKIFYFYNTWEHNLLEHLKDNVSLEEICNISIPVFNNPFFIHDTTFERLASVNQNREQEMWQYDPEIEKYYHPQSIIDHFKTSEEYIATLPTYGAQLFSEKTFGYPILYINLRIDDIYVGRICVCQLKNPIMDKDYELLEFFAGIVISAFQQGNMLVRHSIQHLNKYFYNIINGKSYTVLQLKKILHQYNWHIEDPFLCVSIYFQNPDYSLNNFEYLTRRFQNKFLSASVFQNVGQIIIVLNLNVYQGTKDDFFDQLVILLKNGLLKAGVSTTGHHLENLPYYYQQANIAYQMGINDNEKNTVYHFETYSLSYFWQQATKELLPEMLCSSQLLMLIKYDRIHETEFAKTLQYYLKNERNIKQTACELKIHRSTMNYRIMRLKELLKMDLDNPDVRLYLMISFHLLVL